MVHRDSRIVENFLADTWWYGLSKRLPAKDFEELAALRAGQGFSAIQLVVGVPPEVGPENENAQSEAGFPWTLDGHFNQEYLDLARDRIRYLNNLGLVAIVYGAWGQQIEWIGQERIAGWWFKIIETLDALNVIYCLCGESNLWIGEASKLLPAKSTDDLVANRFVLPGFRAGVRKPWIKFVGKVKLWLHKHPLKRRRRAWSLVLGEMARKTEKPIIVHPTAGETGYEAIVNPELLAANTAQTGHSESSRNRIWQLPLASHQDGRTGKGYINLEPWYEGIRDRFWVQDQLFAYWASMLAGAISHCYGAHGIWNVGDGKFLAHWGKQTFEQARALDTPRLLGLSHGQFLLRAPRQGETFYQVKGDELHTIGRESGRRMVQFFPDIATADHVPAGEIWLPLEGTFAGALPARGQVVIFRD
ncbi:MAG: DUF4038 domain-containing protein [Chloroflexota bacterium]